MKKFLTAVFLILFCFCGFLSAEITGKNYAEYTLSNGISCFVLEDFSKAEIDIELQVQAGISSQNKDNTGFFPLYTRLFKSALSKQNSYFSKNLSSECDADCSRYRISVSPSRMDEMLDCFYQCAFNPAFSDENINKEFSALKTEITDYASSPASLINSSIDSKVFSSAPWKQDSGIYPSLFSKKSVPEIRAILSSISKSWYVPQNTCIFISGSVSKERALNSFKNAFEKAEPSPNPKKLSGVKAGNTDRKFVIYDSSFSKDITQMVVEYTSLSMNQCDLISLALNRNDSSLKKLLLKQRNLAIRDAEYINAASAHKNGSSRLIFQSLLEKPVNKKVTAADQADLFAQKVREGTKNTAESEYAAAKNEMLENLSMIFSNSTVFMDYLAQFNSIQNFDSSVQENGTTLPERLSQKKTEINEENTKELEASFSAESPFVFVLVNSSVYEENKKSFEKNGYKPINAKKGSWYLQKFNETASENDSEKSGSDNALPDVKNINPWESFISENRASIQSFRLDNGIPVTVKNNQLTSTVVILVSIKGGTFYSTEESGFSKAMTNALSQSVQKEVDLYRENGAIEGNPVILAETFPEYGTISVESAKEDASICLKCISEALIFGDITPAEADSCVYAVQTQKRLFNASAVNQLYFRGIKYLYEDKKRRGVFDSENDVLENTNYTEILKAYPQFLNASLYRVEITGNIDKDYLMTPLKNTLGLLSEKPFELPSLTEEKPDFPENKRVSLKLRHLFYTDVKAEDAGPMPAVLVPTTNFSDPCVYFIKAPEVHGRKSHREALIYDAILYRMKELLETNAENYWEEVKFFPRSNEVPASAFALTKALGRVQCEKQFALVRKLLISNLTKEAENPSDPRNTETSRIKDAWLMNVLKKSGENRGTALLMLQGGENPAQYLDDYELLMNAAPEDFLEMAAAFLPEAAPLRIYSEDTK